MCCSLVCDWEDGNWWVVIVSCHGSRVTNLDVCMCIAGLDILECFVCFDSKVNNWTTFLPFWSLWWVWCRILLDYYLSFLHMWIFFCIKKTRVSSPFHLSQVILALENFIWIFLYLRLCCHLGPSAFLS